MYKGKKLNLIVKWLSQGVIASLSVRARCQNTNAHVYSTILVSFKLRCLIVIGPLYTDQQVGWITTCVA